MLLGSPVFCLDKLQVCCVIPRAYSPLFTSLHTGLICKTIITFPPELIIYIITYYSYVNKSVFLNSKGVPPPPHTHALCRAIERTTSSALLTSCREEGQTTCPTRSHKTAVPKCHSKGTECSCCTQVHYDVITQAMCVCFTLIGYTALHVRMYY